MSEQFDKESSATPRVDAIACRHEGPLDENESIEQYNDLLDLARQLERELEEAKDAEARTREKLEDLYEAGTRSAGVSITEPFKAEDDYAPSYVTGPNGFRFQCYNAVKMAAELNALFGTRSAIKRGIANGAWRAVADETPQTEGTFLVWAEGRSIDILSWEHSDDRFTQGWRAGYNWQTWPTHWAPFDGPNGPSVTKMDDSPDRKAEEKP